MKSSKMLISTLKEAPSEAKIDSHVLLLRAGMIKSLVAGVYNYLPLGLRVLKKIEDIVRDEMDKSEALEILSSAMQPRELWDETGRWSRYGAELMRFKDRHEREFCLGPTHEEIFTSLARDLIKSPKNLPMNIYQIQTKYRDEMRPRYGLMRSREFIMKDAYSFDKDEAGLEVSYNKMYDVYSKIYNRFGLNFRTVLADTGAIGGDGSHQFMALSDIGESDIIYCDACGYAADTEKAIAIPVVVNKNEDLKEIEEVETIGKKTIEEVCEYLNVDKTKVCKSLVYYDHDLDKYFIAIVRGDREVNVIKLINAIGTSEAFINLAAENDFENIASVNGYVGPIGLKNVEIFIDNEVAEEKNIIVGANKRNYHLKNVNFKRDFDAKVIDLRVAVEGDKCPHCFEEMSLDRGIEVGQLFKLGTKYSSSMSCTYQNEEGQNVPMVMGCYGIGITRTMQAIVEQFHDEYGIQWPLNVAPYHCVIVPINYDIEEQANMANDAYSKLSDLKVEVVLDDRKAKAGFKFKDWELVGIPYMIVCGKRTSEGIVEFKNRITNEKLEITLEEAINIVNTAVKSL